MPTWIFKVAATFLLGIVLSLVAWSWKGMAQDVDQAQQDINQMQKVITKIETYQEVDQAAQIQQTQILQKMLEAVQQQNAAPDTGSR